MKQIEIKPGEHVAILGATGTGKTVFDMELIRQFILATEGFMAVYILDTKADMYAPEKSDFKEFFRPGIGKRHIGNDIPKPISPKGTDFVQVWTPEEDIPENYNEYFKRIYQARKPALVIVDELSSVEANNRGDITRYHNILLKQGRGLSISSINLTQSSSHIGHSILRQCMHVIRFRLNDDYDSKKLNGLMGRKVETEPPDQYGFWYRNVQIPVAKSPASYYKNMQEFFGLDE